jgi:hydrogenase expression/formation protein HypC
MCIGIPMRVMTSADGVAVCEGRGRRERIDMLLVGDVAPGAWILAFQGSAVRAMSEGEARATDAALDALEAALAGSVDLDRHFADLIDREPQLPDHLKGTRG